MRLRNPTEDKTAFRRMLTSADRSAGLFGGHDIMVKFGEVHVRVISETTRRKRKVSNSLQRKT